MKPILSTNICNFDIARVCVPRDAFCDVFDLGSVCCRSENERVVFENFYDHAPRGSRNMIPSSLRAMLRKTLITNQSKQEPTKRQQDDFVSRETREARKYFTFDLPTCRRGLQWVWPSVYMTIVASRNRHCVWYVWLFVMCLIHPKHYQLHTDADAPVETSPVWRCVVLCGARSQRTY